MLDFAVTPAAADKLLDQLNVSAGEKLRISIQGGGCAGLEYVFEIEKAFEDGDIEIPASTDPSVPSATVVIDPLSAQYLQGAQLDYVSDLFNSRFVLNNPNVTTTCGCGHSFAG